MKATLIISSEYHANQPSVFIMADSQYYGCLIYPQGRNFPQDETYWFTATSSDSDRYFSLYPVEYSDDVFEQIKRLQAEIKENEAKLINESYPWIPRPDASKNSKIYKEYLAKQEAQYNRQKEVYELNRPFDKIIYANKTELRKILLSVRPDEN